MKLIPDSIAQTFILLLLLIILTNVDMRAQISPGKLSDAHAHLEGLSNCTQCHVLGKQMTNSKCLDCHTEIKELINAGRGYHSGAEVAGKNCWSCHSEHHGRNFKLVRFDQNNFDHNKAKFELTGSHAKADCRDCHNQKFITDSKLKKREGTFLGLSSNCVNCHQDYHQKTLGSECNSCHNTVTFRPAPGFDHNESAFKLTGAHLKVDCINCHPKEQRGGKEFQKFKGLSFSTCSSCHRDVHEGRFGQNCQSCHVTASFRQINQAAFDHNKTRFPLVGKHSDVSCNSCHKSSIREKPEFERCTSCHSDYHKGQFTVNEKTADCSDCHNEYGFSPSLFTIERHNKSKFKLTGAHLATACQSCHLKNNEWLFENISAECIYCHNNVHGKELTVKYLPENNCGFCHSTERWNTIDFDHNQTDFKLLGKHTGLNCRDCHYKESTGGEKFFMFASLNSNCEVCHTDIHQGQFRVEGVTDCMKCHTFENWNPVLFDHNKTKFSLVGAHQNLDCSRCHKEVESQGIKFIQYKMEDFRCASCHS